MNRQLDMERVELLAMEKCWGMSDLQRAAGLANMTLYHIKRGKAKASARTIGKVARALEVNPAEIIKQA